MKYDIFIFETLQFLSNIAGCVRNEFVRGGDDTLVTVSFK